MPEVPGKDVLVSVEELARMLAGDDPPVVIDARYRLGQPDWGREQYEAGHVPGAHFVDVDTELSDPHRPEGGGRHPLPSPERFQQVVRRCGVDVDSSVVVLDQGIQAGAARLWWLLRHHGLADVRVLDGGMAAWQASSQDTSTEVPEPGQGSFVAGAGQLPVVDAEGVQRALQEGRRVVDVRAPERFRGEKEPVDPVAGHIPGASNLPASELFSERRLRSPEELREVLGGLSAGDVLSCGSGITASQALLACERAGIGGVQLYAGSWSDWISDPGRPVATGDEGA